MSLESPEHGVAGRSTSQISYHDITQSHPTMVKSSVRILTKEKVGILKDILSVFQAHNLSLGRILSSPAQPSAGANNWEFDITIERSPQEIEPAVSEIRTMDSIIHLTLSSDEVPWFPRRYSDLDALSAKTLAMGEELTSDPPGANDPVYRARRMEVCTFARQYRTGLPIPRIQYTAEEIVTWGTVYNRLRALYETHACESQRRIFPLLEQMCSYSPNNIPQLQDVSDFLRSVTGWSLRPVTGLLTARDFLNAFAFRVFHSTQYIRHPSKPFYTPEPDVCHELLGHAPLFADPDFADFSHEIGLASLGASDADIEKLATVYWFTVEFGLCKEGHSIKAYGAGLLSSFGELEYSLGDKPKLAPFDPSVAAVTKYPITEYQPLYFVADSFEVMKRQMRSFAQSLSRPFPVYYNPFCRTIEVLDSKEKLHRFSIRIQQDLAALSDALKSVI